MNDCSHFAAIFSKNRLFQPAGVLLLGGLQEMGVKGEGGVCLTNLGLDVVSIYP